MDFLTNAIKQWDRVYGKDERHAKTTESLKAIAEELAKRPASAPSPGKLAALAASADGGDAKPAKDHEGAAPTGFADAKAAAMEMTA